MAIFRHPTHVWLVHLRLGVVNPWLVVLGWGRSACPVEPVGVITHIEKKDRFVDTSKITSMEKIASFAILVAVYNGSEYLKRCLDSLLKQTLKDIQVICIDDGSTDNSWEILQSYTAIDQRIEILHLSQNYGIAHARNEGIKHINARYTTILDCDDTFAPDALEQALQVFEKHPQVDCVLFKLLTLGEDNSTAQEYDMDFFEERSGFEAFKDSLTWKIHGVYAAKTALFKQFPYDDTCKTYSDDNSTRLHYLFSKQVSCCHGKNYYHYNPLSVTRAISGSRFDYLRANESMKKQLIQLNVSDDVLTIYENVRWLVLIDLYYFHYSYRKQLSAEDSAMGMRELHRIWSGIEVHRLYKRLKYKFGYMPLRFSWRMFRIQEELYFTLRSIFRKDIQQTKNQ